MAATSEQTSIIEHPDFSLLIDTKNNMTSLPILNQEIWAEYLAITFLFKCFHGNTVSWA